MLLEPPRKYVQFLPALGGSVASRAKLQWQQASVYYGKRRTAGGKGRVANGVMEVWD